MAKVRVDLSGIRNSLLSRRAVDNRTKDKVGEFVDRETKKRIAVGKSPVKGVGRFKAYAVQRKGEGYPETSNIKSRFPLKKTRPVNLKLDGTFLDAIGFNRTKFGVEYGLQSRRKLLQDMFDAHNNGEHPDVPQRKFVPTGSRDAYTTDIVKGIRDIYNDRVSDIIRQMND